MKHDSKEAFIQSLREAAGDDSRANELIRWIDDCGRFVPVIQALPPPLPTLTREEFLQRIKKARETSEIAGIEPPGTYEEFLELRAQVEANRGSVPHFQLKLQEDWDAAHVALAPIDADAQAHYLPDENVAGSGQQLFLEGERRCWYIVFSSQEYTSFWFGIAALHATFVAYKRNDLQEADVRDDVKHATARMLGDPKLGIKAGHIDFMIDGYLLMSRLIERRFRLFRPLVESFGVLSSDKPLAALNACVDFINADMAKLLPPVSEFESTTRVHLLRHCVTCAVLPREMARRLYSLPEAYAKPDPYLEIP